MGLTDLLNEERDEREENLLIERAAELEIEITDLLREGRAEGEVGIGGPKKVTYRVDQYPNPVAQARIRKLAIGDNNKVGATSYEVVREPYEDSPGIEAMDVQYFRNFGN